ncbi:unnamed protein product [Pleuronectes platessa]|uniref:Uncharacterized protein n=1 Tax=Pleuronectes platessa TaxID=8262 RepID=A0A9N7VJS3_PLEPL|nr:unnamed protein product [Pleuronectes platessa]
MAWDTASAERPLQQKLGYGSHRLASPALSNHSDTAGPQARCPNSTLAPGKVEAEGALAKCIHDHIPKINYSNRRNTLFTSHPCFQRSIEASKQPGISERRGLRGTFSSDGLADAALFKAQRSGHEEGF